MRLAFGVSYSTLGDDDKSFNIGCAWVWQTGGLKTRRCERDTPARRYDEGEEFDDVGGLVLDVLDDGGPADKYVSNVITEVLPH